MKIAIGCDHAGIDYKEAIKHHLLTTLNPQIIDVGTFSTESVDYPDFGKKVGETVASGEANKGIVICGTGIGISIAANKVNGIRAALCYDLYTATMARQHNDANVLALGARTTPIDVAYTLIDTFFSTPFEGGRHQQRVNKLSV